MTQKMIRKRDGRLVEFHTEKIRNAIWRSFLGVGQTGMEDVSDALARKVETMLETGGLRAGGRACAGPCGAGADAARATCRTAKAYILYRAERSRMRGR